ncbi:hypothetical protein C8J55DRAFT_604313 [Lentinula edodes]|uniref:Uncharacterized protein n=1 Tax=Lentinula lateritia TaxID=40482 RepID=A0A9W9DUJ2_9AGAR|nr:hypothetical protein C8J55DRAFT_604313 [Lentinula edodes]
MTATPAASKELHYMFAHIEDDKIVEDPDDPTFDVGGPGDNFIYFIAPIRKQRPQIHRKWVLLVPETPIMYAPSETLWDLADMGVWPSSCNVPLIDPVSISVFIVPRSQYAQLNEARDKLTDLRVKNIFQRPQKAPSKGATASTFINDHKSNPCANVRRIVWPLTRSPGVVDLRISILILVNGLEVF